MTLLIAFAFVAGIITILSPCILPILPIVLSGTVGEGKRKPFGIVTGFVLSFTFFTLFLSAIVRVTGIPSDSLRSLSIVIIFLFGLSLFLPQLQVFMEQLFSRLSSKVSVKNSNTGFLGGILVGLSLGLVWTPCVGPIIASVITLAATSDVNMAAFFITFAYAFGTAIPMLAVMYGGRRLLQKVPWLLPNSGKIQKVFGVLMILTAIGIFFNVDRRFQSYILDTFPQYGEGLTSFEDNNVVKDQLDKLFQKDESNKSFGILDERGPKAPEIIKGGEWFNLPAGGQVLSLSELRGKVVLVDFWTYSCINCVRTLPYLRTWHEKYKEKGLVIIGVHAPEFEFEKNEQNVAQAISDFEIKYPVVQDNNFATWRAYSNRYWPAKYLIDKDGFIRYTHFGEGNYEETERTIQILLEETGTEVDETLTKEVEVERSFAQTPEMYLGSARIARFANEENITGEKQLFRSPRFLDVDQFALVGEWNVTPEASVAQKDASLLLKFYANNVYLVITPQEDEQITVLLDGKKVDQNNAGEDVREGVVVLDEPRLYHLIKLQGERGVHTLELRLEEEGTSLFAFTFG